MDTMDNMLHKRALSILLTLALALGISLVPSATLRAKASSVADIWDGTTATSFATGSGTSGSPYEIATAEQLAYMASLLNNTSTYSSYNTKYYKLTADLDLNSIQWTPIVNYDGNTYRFSGNFNGDGHTISNLAIGTLASPTNSIHMAGLFGYVYGGSIHDLGVVNVAIYSITNSGSVGGLSAAVDGSSTEPSTITNCYAIGTVSGGENYGNIGCLIGSYSYGTISSCYSAGSVFGGTNANAGGLTGAGQGSGSINNCYSTCSVTAAGTDAAVSGLIANVYGLMAFSNCYATGNVSSGSATYTGDLIGYFAGGATLNNCYFNNSATRFAGGTVQAAVGIAYVESGSDNTIANTSSYMKSASFVANLGTSWAADTAVKNQGYPILNAVSAVSSTLYQITYDANAATGGTIPTDTGSYPSGASVVLAANMGSLEKTGSTFNGWNANSGGTGTSYSVCSAYSITSNVTMYAKWQATIAAPTVTTQAVTRVTPSTATGNGNITALGSSNPTAYGICWNTTGTPTISDSHVDKGAASSTGSFTASITGLAMDTKYYVCAYATNSVGTAYGDIVTFSTSLLYFTSNGASSSVDALKVVNLGSSEVTTLAYDSANFTQPLGLAVDATNGYIYVADTTTASQGILRYNLDGSNRTVIVPPVTSAAYNSVVLNASKTKLYFTQTGAAVYDALKVVDLSSKTVTTLAGGSANFEQPNGIILDETNGYIYVADTGTSYQGILRFNLDGSNRAVIVPPVTDAVYNDVAINAAKTKLYFTQGSAQSPLDALKSVDLGSETVTTLASDSGNFNQPVGIVLDEANGYIYLADGTSTGQGILRFDLDGSDRMVVVSPVASAFYSFIALPETATTTTSAPTVTTASVTTYSATTATMGGEVTATGGEAVTDRGVVYSSTDSTPTIGETGVTKDANGTGTGTFSKSIGSLSPSTKYYVCAYATNSINTTYGSVVDFTTTAATVTIVPVTDPLTEENLDTSGLAVTLSGTAFVDGTLDAANFTLNNAPTGLTIERVTYTGTTGCTVDLAYDGTDFDTNVTNFSLTVAGAELTFGSALTSGTLTITATVEVAPTVTTASVTTYSANAATLGGEVTATGGKAVTDRGVVYSSTDSTPTIGETSVTKDANGTGTGAFSKSISGLSPSTKYYVCAYASNIKGTAYGSVMDFTTTAATVTIVPVTDPLTEENLDTNGLKATLSGTTFTDSTLDAANFTLNNAPTGVSVESVTYTDATNCTVNLAFDGTDFDTSVTNFSLTIKAGELASGSALTSGTLTITATVEAAPTVTTASVTTYTANAATMGGEVTATGDEDVTDRGVVYSSTDSTPTIGETGVTKDANGTGTGAFSKSISGLSPSTKYYVCAYAINSVNTAYGSVVDFTTTAATVTIVPVTDPLTEENLDTNGLAATLSGTTFVDSTLDAANFTLNNAPVGVSVESVTYTDATNCTVNLVYDGTDFDTSVTNFSLTIKAGELASGSALTSGTLTITATVETAPMVTTASVTTYSATTATMGGEVTATGGEDVTDRGVVYSSADSTPTIGETGVTQDANGTGTGAFSKSISGLSPSTKYYVCAYATNIKGTAYGSVVDFTTTTEKLNAPTGLSWNGSTAEWGEVTNASGYSVQLKKDSTNQGGAISVAAGVKSNRFSLDIWKAGSGSYTFTVKAIGDGTVYADSDDSTSSTYSYTKPAGTDNPMTASIYQGVVSAKADGSSTGGFFITNIVKASGLGSVKIMLGIGAGSEEATEDALITYNSTLRDWYLADIPTTVNPGDYIFTWFQVSQDDAAVVYRSSITLTVNSAIAQTSGVCDFGSMQAGYTAAPAAQTVTIANNGSVTVALTQPTASAYTVGALSTTSLSAGDTATFTLQPVIGLSVGNHDETVTINGSNGAITQVEARFTVLTPIVYAVGLSPSTVDFGSLAQGYIQPAAQIITLTNTGNQNLTLNQPTSARYVIGALSATELTPGSTATFNVTPKPNLPAGVADETIQIYASHGVNMQLNVTFTCTAANTFAILSGDGGVYQHGTSGSTLTIISNGLFANFTGLTLNGSLVPTGDYDASSGSTIVTLHHNFLEALASGKYELVFHYTNGRATAHIVIQDPAAVTGDNDGLVIFGVMALLAAAALVWTLTRKKESRR